MNESDRCELTELRMDPDLHRKWFPPPRRRRIVVWGCVLIPFALWGGILAAEHVTVREATLGPAQDRQLQQEDR